MDAEKQQALLEMIFQLIPKAMQIIDSFEKKQQMEIRKLELECKRLEIAIEQSQPKPE